MAGGRTSVLRTGNSGVEIFEFACRRVKRFLMKTFQLFDKMVFLF
jgi:hypothetical protein